MTDGEQALWRAWEERRDQASFERLVGPHLRFLSDFALRAGCGGEADDAVQTALIELAQARGHRPWRVPLRAWLGRSVLQQARMRKRARRRRDRHEGAAAKPEWLEPRDAHAAHDEVERALSRLDPDARLAVELRYLHDLDYREVALVLKASETACRIRVHRAIARLRKELGVLAPAMIAALPLLGAPTDAHAALVRSATAAATRATLLGGGLLMATKLKICAVALLAIAAFLLWKLGLDERPAPARAAAERRGPADAPVGEPAGSLPDPAPAGPGREGAPGAEDESEPPLSPGNGCVRGLVRFEDGEPLAGVHVSLWGASKVYATTDAQGRFHLHDDWVAARAVYLSGPDGVNGADPFGFLLGGEVKMVEGETVRVEIVLKRGAHVAARVVSAATGDPVAGAEIGLRRWEGDQLAQYAQGGYGCARTDARGGFAFDHVVPDDYSLAIAAKGFEAQYAHWDLRDRALPEVFRLENARRLEIRVKNAPPVATGTRVRWYFQRSGEHVLRDGVPFYRQDFFMLDDGAVMQEGGLLVGDAPPPGRYDFHLSRTDHFPETTQREVPLGNAAVETVTVEIAPGSRVEGTVRWPDRSPVEGAEVWAAGVRAETDAEGRYAFAWLPGAVAGATANFRVRLGGVTFPMGKQTFGASEPRRIDFPLPGSGSVRLELKGAEASKFGAVEIRRPGENDPVVERRIDPPITEPILLRGVPAGPVRLDIWQWGRSWIRRELRVEEGGDLDLGVLELPSWPRPEIHVRVPAGKNPPAWVYVVPTKDPGAPHTRNEMVHLDKEGHGVLPSQPPGLRRILVQGPYVAAKEVEFAVDTERPQPVEVLLDPE